jgi:hypothetical protein
MGKGELMSKLRQRVKRIERKLLPSPKHEQRIYCVRKYDDGIWTAVNTYPDKSEGKPYTDYEKLKRDLGVKDGDIVVQLTHYGNYKQK